MNRVKRLCWALILFTAILKPFKAYCVEIDPYAFRTFVGRISLEFNRSDRWNEDFHETTNGFAQGYSLDTRGFIANRNLLIYDAGVAYSRQDTAIDSTRSGASSVHYYLSTTTLPRSIIPLTLYGSQSHSKQLAGDGQPRTTTNYGLNWFGKFRVLPRIGFWADWKRDGSGDSEILTSDYRATVKKNFDNITNDLSMTHSSIDNPAAGQETSQSSLNFINVTPLSKHTRMRFGAVWNTKKAVLAGDTTSTGLSASLTSRPSREHSQSHSASYFTSESDGTTSNGTSYSGNLGWTISKNLSTSLGFSTSMSETQSPTQSSESERVGANIRAIYRLSQKVSLAQRITFNASQSSTSTEDVTTLRDRVQFKEVTSVGYVDRFDWATFTSSFGLGYTYDKSGNVSGEGVEIEGSGNLGNIDFNRYVGFNAGGEFRRTEQTRGDIWERYYSINIDAFNKYWAEYFEGSAYYRRHSDASWLSALTRTNDLVGVRLSSKYFRNLNFGGNVDYSRSSDEITGDTTVTIRGVFVSYVRMVLGAPLGVGFSQNVNTRSFAGGDDTTTVTKYTAVYTRTLARNLLWQAFVDRNETETDESFINTTQMSNVLVYQFRAWSLSAEHKYRIVEDTARITYENVFFLRASRLFIRIF